MDLTKYHSILDKVQVHVNDHLLGQLKGFTTTDIKACFGSL